MLKLVLRANNMPFVGEKASASSHGWQLFLWYFFGVPQDSSEGASAPPGGPIYEWMRQVSPIHSVVDDPQDASGSECFAWVVVSVILAAREFGPRGRNLSGSKCSSPTPSMSPRVDDPRGLSPGDVRERVLLIDRW